MSCGFDEHSGLSDAFVARSDLLPPPRPPPRSRAACDRSLRCGAADDSRRLRQHCLRRSHGLVDMRGAVGERATCQLLHRVGEQRVARRTRVRLCPPCGCSGQGCGAAHPVEGPLRFLGQSQPELVPEALEGRPGRGDVGLTALLVPFGGVRGVGVLSQAGEGLKPLAGRFNRRASSPRPARLSASARPKIVPSL